MPEADGIVERTGRARGRADLLVLANEDTQRKRLLLRTHIGEPAVEQVIEFGLERHNGPGDSECRHEERRQQGYIEVEIKEEPPHGF